MDGIQKGTCPRWRIQYLGCRGTDWQSGRQGNGKQPSWTAERKMKNKNWEWVEGSQWHHQAEPHLYYRDPRRRREECRKFISRYYFPFKKVTAFLEGVKWCLIAVLIFVSLRTNGVEHLFICACWLFVDLLLFGKMSMFKSFVHFKVWSSFCCRVVRVLFVF